MLQCEPVRVHNIPVSVVSRQRQRQMIHHHHVTFRDLVLWRFAFAAMPNDRLCRVRPRLGAIWVLSLTRQCIPEKEFWAQGLGLRVEG